LIMNASTVTTTGQATANPPALIHHLLSTKFPPVQETDLPDNLDADNIALRATQITGVLKDILEHPGYWHGGLNE
jgi:hypothetical protein